LALRPTNIAMGTMMTCAATIQADIMEVPKFLSWSASFWPTSGSIAALAKWKSTAHAAKTKSGRHISKT
jgi:hypothetical protein